MKFNWLIMLGLGLTELGFYDAQQFKPRLWTILDSSNGPAILGQRSRAVPDSIESFWTVEQTDVEKLHRSFWKMKDLKTRFGQSINCIEKYGAQYMGVVIDGKKFVYINAFEIFWDHDPNELYKGWETYPMVVGDGGASYWGALFDIESAEFSDLSINGSA